MPPWAEDSLPDGLDALGEIGERLMRARAALASGPFEHGAPTDHEGRPLTRVLDVAEAAVTSLHDFAGGLRRRFADGSAIALDREGHGVTVTVFGAPTAANIAAFVAELRRIDHRFVDASELLGLLLGLAEKWALAGFAPPLVLHTLADSAPRILQLGAALSSSN